LTVQAAPPGSAFVASTWNDNSIHFLDANMANLGSFPTGATLPNGVAATATQIFVGHFSNQSMRVFDYNGVFQFSWTSIHLDHCQGLEIVNGELATVYHDTRIEFLDPLTGAFIRSIPNDDGGTVEGLAYDGTLLWTLGDVISGISPATGAEIVTFPNPALNNTAHGGTGLAIAGPNQLMIAGDNGLWWRMSTINGAVLGTGNNGQEMYGLAELVPEPTGAIAMLACVATATLRRRHHCC
jgi:hypothetical protein